MAQKSPELKLADPRFKIRAATRDDVSAMTETFFRSFNAPFWRYLFPDNAHRRQWWHDAWVMGLDNPTDRSFVVEDTKENGRIVAFSRWMVPQQDGNQERLWPDIDADHFDMDVANDFFGGMEENRHALMGSKPHWMLELLGVDESYQGHGIGASLILWGTDQADEEGLHTYLDASEKGQPYYIKHHGFEFGRDVKITGRPEFGSFLYKSMTRLPKKQET